MDYSNIYAKETTFYEAEYIDNIYLVRYNPNDKMKYYQKAQVFRESNTNEIAYCLEPFKKINEQSIYTSIIPDNLTKEQIEKITKIAYFGYGYKDHTDIKWYPITQLLIWKEANPNGDYYFTNGLNGERINAYQRETQEILNYIEWYEETDVLTQGKYDFTIYKEETYYNKPYIFYYSNNSQNLLETGNLDNKNFTFHVNVLHTVLELIKIDKDNQSSTPSGEGVIEGAKFALMDENYYKMRSKLLDGGYKIFEKSR